MFNSIVKQSNKKNYEERVSESQRLFVVAVLNSGNHFSDNNVQGIPMCETDAGGIVQ